MAVVAVPPAGPAQQPANPLAPVRALEALSDAAGGAVEAHYASELGAFDFVRATGRAPLVKDDARATPEARARAFLARYGAVAGLSDAERTIVSGGSGGGSVLTVAGVDRDPLGARHVRLEQRYRGRPVFGGRLIVHLDDRGITGVNGAFVPGVSGGVDASIRPEEAVRHALTIVGKTFPGVELKAARPELQIYRMGLIEGQPGRNALAFAVEVSGAGVHERVVIDALNGVRLARLPLMHTARDRTIYTPVYARQNPDLFAVRRENDPAPSPLPPVENLFRYAGQVYDFFADTFGYDSFDGKGAPMRSVYLINQICPNAYWDGETTNYCPGFDLDDVVAHEWGHAYTQYTHDLVYLCQSGALNESYSDIWAETIDILNGEDGIGGANNDAPYPDGQRWLVGEDLGAPVQELILRDMWDPERLSDPGSSNSDLYTCGADDGGGVHTNSGVPNVAYATLVDGRTLNGIPVRGIGFTKAAHIYFRAMRVYQTVTTSFAQHEQALKASCRDLTGVPLTKFWGGASNEVITASDCEQVARVSTAVNFSSKPSQCAFLPLLKPGAPPVCPGGKVFFSESWEKGIGSWLLRSNREGQAWPDGMTWSAVPAPAGRKGTVAYAPNPNHDTCIRNGAAGGMAMISPVFTIPETLVGELRLRFDHLIATEPGSDGGNVSVSVNGEAFTLIPSDRYLFNGPNGTLGGPGNPNANEAGWTGTNEGEAAGSWGTTVVDLSPIAKSGDRLRLRFDMSMDCGTGVDGWYLDTIQVYDCPKLPAPKRLDIGSDYSKPDSDGSLTLTWNRPKRAEGPDVIQSSVSCAPIFHEDAEEGLGRWDAVTDAPLGLGWDASSGKPNHPGNELVVSIPEPIMTATASLTLREPIAIPAGSVSTLSFSDQFLSDRSDTGYVEISEDRETWTVIHTSNYTQPNPALYLTDPLVRWTYDVSAYGGRSIYLRLRYRVGDIGYLNVTRVAWAIDDIMIENEDWADLATVSGTTHTVKGLGEGVHCFRVQSTYRIRGALVRGLPSSAADAIIAAGVAPQPIPGAPTTRVRSDTLANTGVGRSSIPVIVALLLGAIALGTIVVRSRRH